MSKDYKYKNAVGFLSNVKGAIILVISIVILALLSGCEEDPRVKNPVVSTVAEVEGCVVKYVNRGADSRSFYLARCGETSMVTYSHSSGKYTTRKASLTTSVSLDDQIQYLRDKKAALEKLTPEERTLLGIEHDN